MDSAVKRSIPPDSSEASVDKRLKSEETFSLEGQGDNSGLPSDRPLSSVSNITTLDDDKPIISNDCSESDGTIPMENENERWQVSCRTIKERMTKLFKSDSLTDCTFIVGENITKIYKLHSLILSMASPVFEDLLSDSTNKEIKLEDIEPDIFDQIVEYVYQDTVNLGSMEKTQSLYRAAQKFRLTLIIEKAVELLMANMSFESIWPTLEAAQVTCDVILKTECFKYLKKHTRELLRHPKFVTVDVSILEELVGQEVLEGVSEAELVTGVMHWSKIQCLNANLPSTFENRRHFIGDKILAKLRFLSFPQLTFVKEVAYTAQRAEEAILTREESYSVLLNLIMPGIEPLPDNLCKDARLRLAGKLRVTRKVFNPLGTYPTYTTPFTVGQYDRMVVLANPSPIASFGAKNFCCEILVNHPIILHGIQVPTFFSPQKTMSMDYDESYVITVQQSYNNRNIVTTTWKGKVKYNSSAELLLNDSVNIEKNVKYTIMLFTSNMYYVSRKLTNVENRPPVQFNFKDVVSYFGAPSTAKLGTDFGFVLELIYTIKDK
ncbi:uncharacterized protein LOC142318751 isoform X2 [Lycorma delicatula]|uniref:uncharacterized protein LOC142318751 isoform X2 n=1 Tax=Lycorma delicatula TaxID=130591 RepID=UPI003F519C35